jgi:hypothetical protein
MIKFAVGVVVGIFIATVGVDGVSRMLNNSVTIVQEKAKELAQ